MPDELGPETVELPIMTGSCAAERAIMGHSKRGGAMIVGSLSQSASRN
ncbi:MAG: hypothetical protein U1E28_23030 [Beijerinckiaceae bacterium]